MTDSDNRRAIAQVSRMLRSIVEAETLEHFFWVSGKIDRYHRSDYGHIYFDLVDGDFRIRCMLHENASGDVSIDLKNHLDVEVYGDLRFYERRAEAQINVLGVRPLDDSADNRTAIEILRAEGLYPPRRKPAPDKLERIGVITSRSSLAIGDFESTYQAAGQRAVLAPLTWQYVHLEGDRARQSIADGIALLSGKPAIDAIAIIRGGGRYPELSVFDDINVVRAIARSQKYIVTGIGHHRDQSLADDVADYVAATPTAAATYLADLCLRASDSNTQTRHTARKYNLVPRSMPEPKDASSAAPAADATSQASRGYNLLLLLLALAAIIAIAFLGYAILQTV